MAEYIERETLMLAIEDSCRNNPHSDPKIRQIHNHEHRHFLVLASKQPTADVVEVVRCKDCEYGEADYGVDGNIITPFQYHCEYENTWHRPDHYCGYGKRKIN